MAATSIFVSHNHDDNEFCFALVKALRDAGGDVWLDENDFPRGELIPKIEKELRDRQVFILVVSPAALRSQWVRQEFTAFYSLYQEEPNRVILPVLAEPVQNRDIWVFLKGFKRIEAPGIRPYPRAEAIRYTVEAIGLNTASSLAAGAADAIARPDGALPVTYADGSGDQFDPEPFAGGAEGIVLKSVDGRRVVKLYHPNPSAEGERVKRLDLIVNDLNPARQNAYWNELFAWPIKRVASPRAGVLMPLVDRMRTLDHYFFPRAYLKLDPRDRGSFLDRFEVAIKLVSAARHLASLGLCHGDYSGRNILVDPPRGRVTILDCDTVSKPGVLPPTVAGTHWYRAPELVERPAAWPTPESDRYALAVILYMWMLRWHPLIGDKISDPENAERDDELRFGREALYIEHPDDASNHARRQVLRSDVLGPELQALFRRAFVDGLHEPERRPHYDEWLDAFGRAQDRVVLCQTPGCDWGSFIAERESALVCPVCQQRLRDPATLPLVTLTPQADGPEGDVNANGNGRPSSRCVLGWSGRPLYLWHVMAGVEPYQPSQNRAPDTSAYAMFSWEAATGEWSLINLSLPDMGYRMPGDWPDSWRPCAPQTAIRLLPDMRVRFGAGGRRHFAHIQLTSISEAGA